jgi:hypothetical protein
MEKMLIVSIMLKVVSKRIMLLITQTNEKK